VNPTNAQVQGGNGHHRPPAGPGNPGVISYAVIDQTRRDETRAEPAEGDLADQDQVDAETTEGDVQDSTAASADSDGSPAAEPSSRDEGEPPVTDGIPAPGEIADSDRAG
jgi:hypothetical protein